MRALSDQEIIESVLSGNVNDYTSLINRYKTKAFSLLLRMLRNRMEAEEALQDSFLKAYRNLGSFRKESAFGTWFYKIVYNTAITRLNSKRSRNDKGLISIDEKENLPELNYTGDRNSISEILSELVDQLPENYGTVITLFYINGYNCEEIAGLTNNSVSNVKVLLYRARTALKNKISELKLEKELL